MSASNREGSVFVSVLNYYGHEVAQAYYSRVPVAGDFLALPDGRKAKVVDVDLLPVSLNFDGTPAAVATLFLDAPAEVTP